MLQKLRRIITDLAGAPQEFDPADPRVLAAALLVHVAGADGSIADNERRRLVALVEAHYGLDSADADSLLALAQGEDREAVDLSEFTAGLRRALDPDRRKAVLEMLWEVACADGRIHEFEDSLILRISDLLGVAPAESAAIRTRFAGGGETASAVAPVR
jgi:uncharacterized tellurite resistance protein B-like protein